MRRCFTLLFFCYTISFAHAQNLKEYGWTYYDTGNHSLSNNHISDIQFDKDGRVWATPGGMRLHCWENGVWSAIEAPRPDDKTDGWLRKIAFLKFGSLAISGVPGYLYFYNPKTKTWSYVKTPENKQFIQMACNSKGHLLLGSSSTDGLYDYYQGSFALVHGGAGDVMGIDLHEDKAIVGFRNGTYSFTEKADGSYRKGKLIKKEAFYQTATDGSGNVWATSFTRLDMQRRADTGWISTIGIPQDIYYHFNGTFRYVAHCLAVLRDGSIVMGTQFNPGFALQRQDSWETYMVPLNGEFDGINCIRVAPDSTLWLATWYHGIVVFSHKDNQKHKKEVRKLVAPKKQEPPQAEPGIPDPRIRPKFKMEERDGRPD